VLPKHKVTHCDEYVCLYVRSHISKTTQPNFTRFCVHVTCGRGVHGSPLVALRYVNTLCTSGFADYITFADNGLYGALRVFLSDESDTLRYGQRVVHKRGRSVRKTSDGRTKLTTPATVDEELSDA